MFLKTLLLKCAKILPDKLYLQLKYWQHMHKWLNLKNPQNFTEKLQWLKLYDRNPLYTTMVDKYAVKKWAAEKIGDRYIIPTLGVWDKFEDIDFDKLPSQFVLKTTHDSGGVVICRDKKKFDKQAACVKLTKSLEYNYYYHGREWPYKNVKPRIIAEKYMIDEKTRELRDYKFFCFNGKPQFLFIATDRASKTEETKFDFYDLKFNHLPFTNGHPNSKKHIDKPQTFNEMIRLASILSKDIPHVRVDFYEIEGKLYLGELTFSHWNGFMPFQPPEWDKIIGDWLILPSKKQ